MDTSGFTLPEQVLLLALDDESGSPESRYLGYGLNAAALGELLLAARIRVEAAGLIAADTSPTGDAALDIPLARIAVADAPRAWVWWTRQAYRHGSTLQEILVARLILRGVLTEKEGRVLWVFPHTTYPAADPKPEQELRRQVRQAVLEGGPVDARTAVLLGILHASEELRLLFTGDELGSQERHILEVIAAQPAAEVVRAGLGQLIDSERSAAATAAVLGAAGGG